MKYTTMENNLFYYAFFLKASAYTEILYERKE